MLQENHRVQRVADSIQRELASIIRTELKDPRLGMITISDVEVSKDLSYAKVFITVMGKEAEEAHAEELSILNKAASFLKKHLTKSLTLRVAPQLRFYYDKSISEGNRLSALIDKAISDDKKSS